MTLETPDRAVFSDLERELVRAARRRNAAAAGSYPHQRRARRGVGMLAPVLGAAITVAVVLVAVSSLGHHRRAQTPVPSGPQTSSIPVSARERSNERAARLEAYRLLELVNFPAGTLPVSGDISATGQGGVSTAPFVPGNQIEAHSFWRVPGKPATVIAWFEAHPPRGAANSGKGSGGTGGATLHWNTTFGYAPIPGRISWRAVTVTTSAARGGGTAVRVDAQAVWVIPRPASAIVPDTVNRIEWSSATASYAADHTFTSPRAVRRLVAALNAVPITRPVPGNFCFPTQGGLHGFRFVLLSPGRTAPVAVATWTGCGTVALDIAGKRYFLWPDTADPAASLLAVSFMSGTIP